VLRPRFFTDQALTTGVPITLDKEASRHVARALRMRVEERLCLFDGEGTEATGRIAAIERDRVTVEIDEAGPVNRESPLDLTLVIALSRGDRMDTVVQKATELGVRRILPVISERTGVRLDAARLEKKREHWRKIAISACEQCGRNLLPHIEGAVPLRDALEHPPVTHDLNLVLHPGMAPALLPATCTSLSLLIGPEGGFSGAEVQAAQDAGFEGIALGPRILRTETAPLAAITLAQSRWGDLP